MITEESEVKQLNRRRFLSVAGSGAAAISILPQGLVRGSPANERVRLGLIGCGGRGSWIAALFKEHSGYELVGAADYFEDRVREFGRQFQVPEKRQFTGLSGYRRLLESGVDAVAIESPPYFHPEQAAAAVDAGLHVYLAKPIAVDVPGCKTVEESGRKAGAKKLCFLIDFQTRANEFFIEAIRRVHEGALGKLALGEATYHAEDPFTSRHALLRANPDDPETRLRAWGLDRALSGDIITEQNIHTLDVMSWIMNCEPLAAVGTGARKVRNVGDCRDCYTLVYSYPDAIGVSFSSRQFYGHRTAEGIKNRMFGNRGVVETEYGGVVQIRSDDPYAGGKTHAIYREGAMKNIAAFHSAIVAGNSNNPTVAPSVRSNLITILGRQAADTGESISWQKLMKSEERLEPRLKGLKA